MPCPQCEAQSGRAMRFNLFGGGRPKRISAPIPHGKCRVCQWVKYYCKKYENGEYEITSNSPFYGREKHD